MDLVKNNLGSTFVEEGQFPDTRWTTLRELPLLRLTMAGRGMQGGWGGKGSRGQANLYGSHLNFLTIWHLGCLSGCRVGG